MKNSIWILLGILFFVASCEKQVEQHEEQIDDNKEQLEDNDEKQQETAYDLLAGEWYLYGVYQEGSTPNSLALLKLLYPCITNSTVIFVADSTFRMVSDCEDGNLQGTYVIQGDSVIATDTTNEQHVLLIMGGFLSQKRTILDGIPAELRFQKTQK